MEGKRARVLAMAVKLVAGVVFIGWVMMWIMLPTSTHRQKWRPTIRADTISTYFGTSGSNILIYTFPILFLSILGCVYAHLERRRTYSKRTSCLAIWKRPLLVRGPLGILSYLEVAFFLMFLILIIWCFSTYLRVSFSKINSYSAANRGEKVWEAKLDSAALRLGLVGNICLAFLFFPVTRGSSLLPLIGLTSESSVRYHIWVGHITMAIFTAHGLCYLVLWIATANASEMIEWSKVGESNLAGELSLLCGLVLWVTTFPKIRRRMFELFFYTHQLYLLFLLFFLLHVGISFFYLALPGVYLFMLDRCLRFLQSRQRAPLVNTRILPGEIVELNFEKHPKFEYTAASLVFINVPSISKLQWHPFTVCSSSNLEPEKLSVIIKKEGRWTQELYQRLSSHSASDPIDVSVEGPYGPISNHFLRYDSLVLISGGGGITPLISIIRELIHTSKTPNCPSPDVHLICAFKTSSDLSILNLLLPSSNSDVSSLQLRIDAFVTREKDPTEDWIKEHVGTISFKPSPNATPISPVLGPNSWLWLAVVIASSFVAYLVLLGLINRYYIYPIDNNTNKVYPYSAKSMLSLLLMCVAIGGAAAAAVWRGGRRMAEEGPRLRVVNAPTPKATPGYAEGEVGTELESLPREAVLEAAMVQYGARPDLKKMLMECKQANTGVFVSGPAAMRRDVAAICASGLVDYLHFESFSFTW